MSTPKTAKPLDSFDVVVIGAGHAGIEAALAAARLGVRVAVFTLSLDAVGNMPCNPAIGGTAKSQLVREVDALGGEMGVAADSTALQVRMLGMSKGAAVRALRVQTDRDAYRAYMKHRLERQDGVHLKQAEIVDILTENGAVCGVVNRFGNTYRTKAVVIATGTYLRGRIFAGATSYESGPDGQHAANLLSDSLAALGVTLRRFKTGTPARVKKQSLDLENLETQRGEEHPHTFSYSTAGNLSNLRRCYIAYTDEAGHDILRRNLHLSPLYTGDIVGTGPRYCPSIEDKVVRFADKKRHQMFIEPCGLDTQEMYVQGMSSSMPEEVQLEFYRSIKGFEQVEIMRPAYAIEYDCVDSLQLGGGLQFKAVAGLYGAGQFNGTSGYEEAAAQGLIAGLNAARYAQGLDDVVLSKTQSYIGSLIDDLVTRGTDEPYRMMTARSDYRLVLRQDNADHRLCPLAHELGLLQQERWDAVCGRQDEAERLTKLLKTTNITPVQARELPEVVGEVRTATRTADLLKRPGVNIDMLLPFLPQQHFDFDVLQFVETDIKYEGYIAKQQQRIAKQQRDERLSIPPDFAFDAVTHLSLEAREKLQRVRPISIAQAAAIPGLNPTDISVLTVAVKSARGRKNKVD